METKPFVFALNQPVRLAETGEPGRVVGCAHFTNASDSYLIRYAAADGRQTESWWAEDAIRRRE